MAPKIFNGVPLAPWWKRVFCYQADGLLAYIPYLWLFTVSLPVIVLIALANAAQTSDDSGSGNGAAGAIGGGLTVVIVIVCVCSVFAFAIWNVIILRGATGRSLGSRVWSLRLVSEYTGMPIGGGATFLRGLCHILDALPLGLGFLFPLWTAKRQTFADMIMHTVVVVDDRPVPPNVTSFRGPRPPQNAPQGGPQFTPQFQTQRPMAYQPGSSPRPYPQTPPQQSGPPAWVQPQPQPQPPAQPQPEQRQRPYPQEPAPEQQFPPSDWPQNPPAPPNS